MFMTSVQNHLPRLNGSSRILILVLALAWSGCALFKPATDKSPTVTDTSKEEKPKEVKVDTIEWEIVSEEDAPPIINRGPSTKSTFKDVYQVALLAPFSSDQVQYESAQLSGRTNRLIQFYLGLRYGLERLVTSIPMTLRVVDTEKVGRTPQVLSELPEVIDADLIIGPYFNEELIPVAEYAKSTGKVIISPWNSGEVVVDNPFFVQVRPSLETHCKFLTREIRKRYDSHEIMLIGKSSDRSSLHHCQQEYRRLKNGNALDSLAEFIIEDVSDPTLADTLRAKIEAGTKAFLIPKWSDEPYVISILSKLNFAKADSNVTVFGLPQWATFYRMDFDYYENLNVHISSARPLRINSEKAKTFRKAYFSRYGAYPTDEAYFGMELIQLVSYLLQQNGTLIYEGFSDLGTQDFAHDFEFVQIFGEDGESIKYYLNQHLNLYRFINYRFEKVDF